MIKLQRIIEPIIQIIYLTIVFLISSYMYRNSLSNKLYKIFATLALVLGIADSIYIIPRMYALLTTGIEDNLNHIGWGRMGNAIAITVFFLILYDAYNIRYNKRLNPNLNRTLLTLSTIRIILCLLPYNEWFNLIPNSKFALIRFIPLGMMGILLLIILFKQGNKLGDTNFKIIAFTTFIALICLEPRIYFSEGIGLPIFTIIRSISLVIIVLVGYKELRDINELSRY